jgi:hypothetical protein
MAVATPSRPSVASGAGELEPPAPRALLLAVMACLVFACFASGATDQPAEQWLQLSLAACAVVATGTWLYAGGIRFVAARSGLAGIALLVGFAAWAAISINWSVAPDRSWAEANRVLAFALTAVLGVFLGASLPRAPERLGAALALASVPVALYALGGKTLPGIHIGDVINLDQTAAYNRLRAPFGYWNALALGCVSGLLPMLRIAADGARSQQVRVAAVLGVYLLGLVLALTYSRGGLLALVAGIAVLVALGRDRMRTLILFSSAALAAGVPLAVALSREDLTQDLLPLSQRTDDALIVFVVFLAAGALLFMWARALLTLECDPRFSPERGRVVGRRLAIGSAAVVGAVLIFALATGEVGDAIDGFKDPSKPAELTDPNRVLDANSGNRWIWWREAAGAWSDEKLRGWGSGSFPVTHKLYRKEPLSVQQPHSVPLQWLAEDGLVGFALAAGAILALLVAALARVRALEGRSRSAAAALLAVAVAWIVHSLFEWSWDIPAITLPMFLCLGVLAAREPRGEARPVTGRGPLLGVALVATMLFAISAVLPALSVTKSADALRSIGDGQVSDERLAAAAGRAAYAARLNPLAAEPLVAAASIAERRGDQDGARRLLLRALRRQPYDAEAWTALVRIEVLRGDRAATLAAARRALEIDPLGPVAISLAEAAAQNVVFPNESSTATGTPLPRQVPVVP